MSLLSKVKDIFKSGSSTKRRKTYHNVKLENPEENWEIIGELGDGAYGTVFKAQHLITRQLAALKQVVLEGDDDLETFMIEIDILSECKHPNIVELLEAYHYDGKLWMYLEYCDGGAVDSIMVDLDRSLTESQISYLCKGLCQALSYIHSHKVIHRDLKAGNVLLTMDGGVKLADFGVSAKNKNTFEKRGTFIGTPYWLAPEVILCETFIDAKYDFKADIWSLGISLIEFAQMDPPNHEISPVRVMLKIQKSDPPKLDFPAKWSKEFNDFIAKCLTKDPVQRPSSEELLKHPFLTGDLSMKPIKDLLLEYKAEVVEEEVDEDSEEQDPSRSSTVCDNTLFNSQYDRGSLISVDKEPNIQPKDDKIPGDNAGEQKEATPPVSPDRKISKGPAPLPPTGTTATTPTTTAVSGSTGSHISPPKKGPAPAVPPSSSSVTVNTSASVSTTSSSNEITSSLPVSPVITATPVGLGTVPATSPSATESASVSKSDKKVERKKEEPLTLTKQKSDNIAKNELPSSTGNVPLVDRRLLTQGIHNLEEQKMTLNTDLEVQVKSGLIVEDTVVAEQRLTDKDRIAVNKLEIKELHDTDSTVIKENIIEGEVVTLITADSCIDAPSDEDHSVSLSFFDGSSNIDISTIPVPVTFSVLSPEKMDDHVSSSTPLPTSVETTDVLLASISSEGTVIVRTPTPTPGDISRQIPRSDSVVTYTVTEDKERSQMESQQSYTLDEAEAHAVHILETAIDSAMDASLRFSDEASEVSSPTSFTEELLNDDSKSNAKGDVIVIASDNVLVEESDLSAHKLDESEVLISNSSMLHDESVAADEQSKSRFELTLEKVTETDLNSSVPLGDESHISVIAVKEDGKDAGKNEIMEYGNKQLSMIIEGTTMESTDVDDLDSTSSNLQQVEAQALSTSSDSGFAKDSPVHIIQKDEAESPEEVTKIRKNHRKHEDSEVVPLQPVQNGVRRQSSRSSERSDSDTTSTVGSDKENQHRQDDGDFNEEVMFRNPVKKSQPSPALSERNVSADRVLKNKEQQESIALRKKTRKRTRKFVIDGVTFTTTTSKVIYGDDEESFNIASAHLARRQELRELKRVQRQEQKQFQELGLKANFARQEQEKKFDIEKTNLIRNYDSQIENLIRQQKQMVEKAEARQEAELKAVSKKTRSDQEKELKSFRESLKQEWKLLKHEIEVLPKEHRKDSFRVRKEQLDRDQMERERAFVERLNEGHELTLKRLSEKHRKHIALKERQFLEEKHQLLRSRESSLWDMEERQIQDKHQLAKEQLKDIYFLQRYQMAIRHNVEQEQVKRLNQQKEDVLLKRHQAEKRQLPKRIRQEMKTREKMFREQIRISMTMLPSQEEEKEQIRKFQEQEKIKYDKERKRAEMKHKKQLEELQVGNEASIQELIHLQNEKGKLLTEQETVKLKSLDEEYHRELKDWKANLAPRKQKLEEGFERQLIEQEKFYGDYLDKGLDLSATPCRSSSSLGRSSNS